MCVREREVEGGRTGRRGGAKTMYAHVCSEARNQHVSSLINSNSSPAFLGMVLTEPKFNGSQ